MQHNAHTIFRENRSAVSEVQVAHIRRLHSD